MSDLECQYVMERDSIVGYLRGFIPWIASGVVSSFDLRWGALAGFLTGVFLLVQDLRRRVEADSLILEISSICYFAVVGVLAVLFPHSALETYQDAISFTWLALTAWGTLAIRSTLHAGHRAPPDPAGSLEPPRVLPGQRRHHGCVGSRIHVHLRRPAHRPLHRGARLGGHHGACRRPRRPHDLHLPLPRPRPGPHGSRRCAVS